MPDTTTGLLSEAADRLEKRSRDRHQAVHGSKRTWADCAKDGCDDDRLLVVGLRQLADIRNHHPGATP